MVDRAGLATLAAMGPLPQRSPGVLVAPMADLSVAYDLLTETAHLLNPSAGELLARCDGGGSFGASVQEWAGVSGADPAEVAADVETALAEFARLGLVDRRDVWTPPDPPAGATLPGDHPEGLVAAPPARTGATHRAIDFDIAFRSADPELLDIVDAHLGTGRAESRPTTFFDVDRIATGELRLCTETERTYPDLGALLDALAGVVNEYAVRTHSCAALHAAALRAPGGPGGGTGEIVLLPAPSGHGKSTLAAALVAAGWDYLGDEAIGVRPVTLTAVGYPKRVALDAASRTVLGLPDTDAPETRPEDLRGGMVRLDGDVGPIGRVVLPRYVEGAEAALEALDPAEAIVELLANTLNLARSREVGLAAVCDLAGGVPVHRLTHSGAADAVALIGSLVAPH